MTGQTNTALQALGRRRLIATAAGLAIPAFSGGVRAQSRGGPLREVPRNRTYILASTNDGPVLTNIGNANFYAPGVDLRNGMMFATEPLFWYNFFKGELIPWLAESYVYNDDFTELTIKIRVGAAWSDGHPFTARDVAFTYNMLVENGTGKRNLRQAVLFSDRVKQAEAVDDLTVRITFTRPDPRHLFAVTTNYFSYGPMWVPEHVWSEVDDKAGFTFFDLEKGWPLTTSAWKVVATSPTQIVCDRRDDWWGAKTGFRPLPAPERIITVPSISRDQIAQRAVANVIDISTDMQDVALLQEMMRRNPKITTFSGNKPPYGNLDWWPISLFFNGADPRWEDLRVRRAMGFALNVQQIVQVSSGGASDISRTPFPNFPPLLPVIRSFDDLVEKHRVGVYDPKEVEQLMAEAGYQRDAQKFWAKDGKRAGGDMHGLSIVNQIGPLVQQQLRRAGFDVTFYSQPDSTRIMANGQCPLVLSGHSGSSIFDPLATLEAFHSKNFAPVGSSSFFFARQRNTEYDALVEPIYRLKPGDPQIPAMVHKVMDKWYALVPEIPIQQYYHRVPMNQTYWTNWPGNENPYMPPAPNHVSTSVYIAHMVRPVD
jgi:peptide/nickel transport system substrate-binding protein